MAEESILIVDDDLSMRQFLKIRLDREGYKTTLAGTGEEARTLFELNPYDLILTDLNLPGLSGMDLLRDVHAHAEREVPVIIITGYGTAASAVEASSLVAPGTAVINNSVNPWRCPWRQL